MPAGGEGVLFAQAVAQQPLGAGDLDRNRRAAVALRADIAVDDAGEGVHPVEGHELGDGYSLADLHLHVETGAAIKPLVIAEGVGVRFGVGPAPRRVALKSCDMPIRLRAVSM